MAILLGSLGLPLARKEETQCCQHDKRWFTGSVTGASTSKTNLEESRHLQLNVQYRKLR